MPAVRMVVSALSICFGLASRYINSAGSNALYNLLFLSTCVKQGACVYAMDFVSGHI